MAEEMYINNAEFLKELFQDAFNEELEANIRIEKIMQIKKQVDNYLEKYKNYSNAILTRYYAVIGDELSQSTKKYQAIKAINGEQHLIEELLKEGYLYVNIIREFLTGEKILYQVGIFDEEKSELIEGTMSIFEILENSTLDVDSKIVLEDAAKLRMKEMSYQSIGNPVKIDLEGNVENASSVFSAVYNFTHNSLHNTPKVNEGVMYETYQSVLIKYYNGKNTPVNPPPLSISKIEEVYNEAKKNNVAYYKGGDIGRIQVKYLGGRPPSITTLSSIKRVLTNISYVFKNIGTTKKNNIVGKNKIAKLLGKNDSKITNKMLSVQQKKIKETLDRLEKSLKLKN